MGLTVLKTKADLDNAVKNGGKKLVVVDCYADWCGPCKKLAPQLEELSKKKTDVLFYKMDIEENDDVATERKISSLPTILFYKNGVFLGDFCGANFKGISETIDKLLKGK